MNYLIDVQFNMADRGDVNVVFVDPVARSALYEIARLPGVLRSRGGARRAGAPARRPSQPTAPPYPASRRMRELRQLLDTDLHRVPLPADGVLLLPPAGGTSWASNPATGCMLESLEGHPRQARSRG